MGTSLFKETLLWGKYLGLDLGTTSIGWALVEEDQSKEKRNSKIVKLGVRIIQYDTFSKVDKKSGKIAESKNPTDDFASGKGLSPNAKRTQQRGARRNLQRYKQRRKNLIEILVKEGLIAKETPLTEIGKNTTYQTLSLRAKSVKEKINLEDLARVFLAINKKRGYLGAISDRSKDLYFKKETVGENLYKQIKNNPHTSLRNQVFYRQDYLDEFEKIWQTQAEFRPQLTNDLKEKIRDIIIFYQRKLKSQKGLLSFCEFESREGIYIDKKTGKPKIDKKTCKPVRGIMGNRVISKSSPLFQEFKIWQNLNNLEFTNKNTNEKIIFKEKKLDDEITQEIFETLNIRGNLKSIDILKLLSKHIRIEKTSDWKCNFKEVEGNRTNQSLHEIYQQIAENKGLLIIR